ncbi:hypothetical protein [Modestobacter sp. SSW1-42]|uniref:hypothetical protein n=1 Tax=Modestobacter sp. SSW1-42 TaxID=596372 RepID=UPI0039889823
MPDRTPPGLKAAGKRLWASVTDEYDLDVHEEALLLEACRTKDLLNELDSTVRREGVVIPGEQGPRVHPAVTEARLQKTSLNQLIASLRLPNEEGTRPQRRGSARRSYGIRGAVS